MDKYVLLKNAVEQAVWIADGRGIVIYPFGELGMEIKRILNEQYGINEKCIVDNELAKINTKIYFLEQITPEMAKENVFIISSDNNKFFEEIREQIRLYVPEENIVDAFPKVRLNIDRRIETLRLMAEQIHAGSLDGNVAELGVYKGGFARYINKYFPKKVLYLFDTFEGFRDSSLDKFVDKRFEAWMECDRNVTNYCINHDTLDVFLKNFSFPDMCVIRQGFFPDTTEGLNDSFCFVSLDVDLYQGTKAGLDYFYPRLVKKGILMIHDYNSYLTPGVKKAVDEFCKEQDIGIVCIPDGGGTAIIIKI